MSEVEVVGETRRAHVLLHETRLALLGELSEPSSAVALARRLGLPRQRVNYHLRELERERLVEVAEERRRGSCVERAYRRTGRAFCISPAALGPVATDPGCVLDRFSSAYQLALAARTIEELDRLRSGARAAGQRLATFALDAEVRFRSPEDRASFAEELAGAVAELVRRYHDEGAPGGRAFRLYAGAYPRAGCTEPG